MFLIKKSSFNLDVPRHSKPWNTLYAFRIYYTLPGANGDVKDTIKKLYIRGINNILKYKKRHTKNITLEKIHHDELSVNNIVKSIMKNLEKS